MSKQFSPVPSSPDQPDLLHISDQIVSWYQESARALPWRHDGASAWEILVSEFMLQQTQVDRVIPRWTEWLTRWPTPAALAAAPIQDAIIAWDRLGYPRRALWLHQTATIISTQYGGVVPDRLEDLLALPGVGEYTARAVAVFAHRQRHPVVDTNIRRVVARVRNGQGEQGPPSHRRDLAEMEEFLPADPVQARLVNYAVMEFGAVVCTSRSPQCGTCPIRNSCRWSMEGFPEFTGKRAAVQKKFEGSDRQVRGQIMALLRANPAMTHSKADVMTGLPAGLPAGLSTDVPAGLPTGVADTEQVERALASLIKDGLVVDAESKSFRLP